MVLLHFVGIKGHEWIHTHSNAPDSMCVNVQIFSTLENYIIHSGEKKNEYWLDGLINIFMNISAFATYLHIQHTNIHAINSVWDTLLIQYSYVWYGHIVMYENVWRPLCSWTQNILVFKRNYYVWVDVLIHMQELHRPTLVPLNVIMERKSFRFCLIRIKRKKRKSIFCSAFHSHQFSSFTKSFQYKTILIFKH